MGTEYWTSCAMQAHTYWDLFCLSLALEFLMHRVRHKEDYVIFYMAIYCLSLSIMYLSSTLYHSFFDLGHEVLHIFAVLDYTGIFLLIAGSYSPFLGILFHGETWAQLLLGAMWAVAITGMCSAAFYTGPHQQELRLVLYVGMGWTILTCIWPLTVKLGLHGTVLLFGGGVLYTAGLPWFVRKRHTFDIPDHTIWHLFVVAAIIVHYLCIYWYVAGEPKHVGDSIEDFEESIDGDSLLLDPGLRAQDDHIAKRETVSIDPLQC
ncbi:unnamed protein product [Polarella glacialis]|uniref:Hemolysin III n=1 Tax=Polarella glacialis TaxID=89957 RepID=A0A813H5C4_POLGL|nr:unnamed protein product [Polarella glacialis]CAE8646890.1 unnamed protein product [Polarella glacialis]